MTLNGGPLTRVQFHTPTPPPISWKFSTDNLWHTVHEHHIPYLCFLHCAKISLLEEMHIVWIGFFACCIAAYFIILATLAFERSQMGTEIIQFQHSVSQWGKNQYFFWNNSIYSWTVYSKKQMQHCHLQNSLVCGMELCWLWCELCLWNWAQLCYKALTGV